MKNELRHILQGKSKVGKGNLIETAARNLRRNEKTDEMVTGSKPKKLNEATRLKNFPKENNIWIEDIDLDKHFMEANGFKNIRNHDYVNDDFGIILEDLHDENVQTRKGVLYFVDTVFYLKNNFWN